MSDTKSEIKLYLEKALTKENLKDISVDILGNTEKGAGYMGDIVFVNATGIDTNTNEQKNLNLVLKCSKKSQALRDSVPIKDVFHKEIFMYHTILPEFQQFQRSKSLQKVFDSFPKYYGHFTNETTEIIVLENLKKIGYELWNQRKPLTTKHLLMVVENYGIYHATSAAFRLQNPKRFNKFCEKLEEHAWKFDDGGLEKLIDGVLEDVLKLLENSCNDEVLEKLKHFKGRISYVYNEMFVNWGDDFRIISHGDCWNNNFMWKHSKNNPILPEKVAFLDWQVSSLSTPIMDLSYFIFSCISKDDLNNFNTVLDTYYNSFSQTLKQLGNNPDEIYPKKQFLNDWQKYGHWGFGNSLMINKFGFAEKDNLPDMGQSANEGKNFGESLMFDISDSEGYKQRIQPLVEFAAKTKLIG